MFLCVGFILLIGSTYGSIQGLQEASKCDNVTMKYRQTHKIFTQPKTWNQAKTQCEKEGAILFYPKDNDEALDILQYYWCHLKYSTNGIFIGVADWIVDDIFVTVDGQPIAAVYDRWVLGEPNNDRGKGCVVLGMESGLVNDYCNSRHNYICKTTLQKSSSDQACGLSASGYKYSVQLKKCYKFHLTPRNWTDANDICNAEGSHLAVINSEAEAKYLVSITAAANKDRVKGDYVKGAVLLGFKKDGDVISSRFGETIKWEPNPLTLPDINNWVTVEGTILRHSGYNTWGTSHRLKENSNCGAMLYNGQLNDIGCHEKMFFICEHQIQDWLIFTR